MLNCVEIGNLFLVKKTALEGRNLMTNVIKNFVCSIQIHLYPPNFVLKVYKGGMKWGPLPIG